MGFAGGCKKYASMVLAGGCKIYAGMVFAVKGNIFFMVWFLICKIYTGTILAVKRRVLFYGIIFDMQDIYRNSSCKGMQEIYRNGFCSKRGGYFFCGMIFAGGCKKYAGTNLAVFFCGMIFDMQEVCRHESCRGGMRFLRIVMGLILRLYKHVYF
jgi:hypothetical protein